VAILTFDAASRLSINGDFEVHLGIAGVGDFLHSLLWPFRRSFYRCVNLHSKDQDHWKELHELLHCGVGKESDRLLGWQGWRVRHGVQAGQRIRGSHNHGEGRGRKLAPQVLWGSGHRGPLWLLHPWTTRMDEPLPPFVEQWSDGSRGSSPPPPECAPAWLTDEYDLERTPCMAAAALHRA
jgi:hypothetical protein